MIFVYLFLKITFPSSLPQGSPGTMALHCMSATLHRGPFQRAVPDWLPFVGMQYLSTRDASANGSVGEGRLPASQTPRRAVTGVVRGKKTPDFFLSSGLGQTDRHNKMCGCHLAGVNRSDKLQYTSLVVLNCLHASDLTAPYTDLLPQSFTERIHVTQTWPLWTFASRLPAW